MKELVKKLEAEVHRQVPPPKGLLNLYLYNSLVATAIQTSVSTCSTQEATRIMRQCVKRLQWRKGLSDSW